MIAASSVIVAVVMWAALAAVVLGVIHFARRTMARDNDWRMRHVARVIDAGNTCPCCSAEWHLVDDNLISINGAEVRRQERWEMDHGDWCEYAEWAGL